MENATDKSVPLSPEQYPSLESPFLRAPERARTVFLVTLGAACAPLVAGAVFFGWRALAVAAICVASCVWLERMYYRVTHVPALLGRSHAYLTGLLLALTLPPFVPWYVAVTASAFAIVVGKIIFGGVGHFLWQPALIGRLAVAVIFPALTLNPECWPVLPQSKLLVGDIRNAKPVEHYRQWKGTEAPVPADALLVRPTSAILDGLTSTPEPEFSGIAMPADIPQARSPVLNKLPPISDFFYGARPGEIGETCIIVIAVAGLYLVYRNYVKWQLPFAIIASAWVVAAIAPVKFAGPNDTIVTAWLPLVQKEMDPELTYRLDIGMTYVNYQVLSSPLFLAAFFFATEMTSRPVATGGQVIFGIGVGVTAMLLKLYMGLAIAPYMAVLAMNTFTPTIDRIWRPRVFGRKWFHSLRRGRKKPPG